MQADKTASNSIFNKIQLSLKLIPKVGLAVLFFLTAFLASAAESSEELGGESGPGAGFDAGLNVDSLLQVLIALISVVFIIFALSVLLKKFNMLPGASAGLIKIVGGISLGSKERLLLIQVGDEQILISASSGRINKIHELTTILDPEAASAVKSPTSSNFSSLLNSMTSRMRS